MRFSKCFGHFPVIVILGFSIAYQFVGVNVLNCFSLPVLVAYFLVWIVLFLLVTPVAIFVGIHSLRFGKEFVCDGCPDSASMIRESRDNSLFVQGFKAHQLNSIAHIRTLTSVLFCEVSKIHSMCLVLGAYTLYALGGVFCLCSAILLSVFMNPESRNFSVAALASQH